MMPQNPRQNQKHLNSPGMVALHTVARSLAQQHVTVWQGVLVALVVSKLDHALKKILLETVGLHHSVPLWPGVVDVTVTANTGIAWSGFAQYPDAVKWASTGLTVLVVMLALRLRHPALWLVVGGAVANAMDRWVHGAVIDYVHLVWVRFPIFNLADMAIVIGSLWQAMVVWWVPRTAPMPSHLDD
jgi:signal peptidase II